MYVVVWTRQNVLLRFLVLSEFFSVFDTLLSQPACRIRSPAFQRRVSPAGQSSSQPRVQRPARARALEASLRGGISSPWPGRAALEPSRRAATRLGPARLRLPWKRREVTTRLPRAKLGPQREAGGRGTAGSPRCQQATASRVRRYFKRRPGTPRLPVGFRPGPPRLATGRRCSSGVLDTREWRLSLSVSLGLSVSVSFYLSRSLCVF